MLPSGQSRIIEPAKFTYSLLAKALEKPTKTIEDQVWIIERFKSRFKKQLLHRNQKSIVALFSKKIKLKKLYTN